MSDDLFAFLHALYWACLVLVFGLAIVGALYWADTLRGERDASRKHFGGV